MWIFWHAELVQPLWAHFYCQEFLNKMEIFVWLQKKHNCVFHWSFERFPFSVSSFDLSLSFPTISVTDPKIEINIEDQGIKVQVGHKSLNNYKITMISKFTHVHVQYHTFLIKLYSKGNKMKKLHWKLIKYVFPWPNTWSFHCWLMHSC